LFLWISIVPRHLNALALDFFLDGAADDLPSGPAEARRSTLDRTVSDESVLRISHKRGTAWHASISAREAFPPPGDPARPAYERTEAAVSAVPAGSGGLSFFPNLTGSRAPDWDTSTRGWITGIGPEHGWGHFARAIMKGAAAQAGEIVALAQAAGTTVKEVRLVGGGVRSAAWERLTKPALAGPIARPPSR
jgi:sugar (pentulose or hexulose) kinase